MAGKKETQLAKLTLSRGCSASLPDRIPNNRHLALVPKLRKKAQETNYLVAC
jgi:hypothetical protein